MTEHTSETDTADDWSEDILRAITGEPSPEDAAMASAAAWLTHTSAEAAAVIVFMDDSTCIMAHGFRDDSGEVEVSVGREQESVMALLDDRSIVPVAARAQIFQPELLLKMPDRLAAVAVKFTTQDFDTDHAESTKLATSVTERILSNTTARACLFVEPRHTEAMAEFSAGAGHEINNPLGSIIGQTQLLLKKTDGADYREALETIGAQAWRIRDMIGDSMLFARPPRPERRHCNVSEIVNSACERVRSNDCLGDAELSVRLPVRPVMAEVDAAQLATLVTHLVRNSREATAGPDNDRRISVTLTPFEQHSFSLVVEDNSPGITDDAIRRHLFDPFFSGRQAGRGLGFGLCLCWRIVLGHGGLLLQQNIDGGCRFIVGLPVA